MSTDDPLNSADSALWRKPLEAQLAGLRPTTAAVDRDRLMFAAGRAAAAPMRWTNAATFVAAACAALAIGRWTAPTAAPFLPESSSIAQQSAPPSIVDFAQAAELRDPASLLQLRLHFDALDAPRGSSISPSPAAVSPRALLHEMLN